jgi:hypothetical protein
MHAFELHLQEACPMEIRIHSAKKKHWYNTAAFDLGKMNVSCTVNIFSMNIIQKSQYPHR